MDSWPSWVPLEDSTDACNEEKKSAQEILITRRDEKKMSNVLNLERNGNLIRLLRVTAYVVGFVGNLKKKREAMKVNVRRLNVEEIEIAERLWIEFVQQLLRQDKILRN